MSEKTVHKNSTPHGYKTPHKYPFINTTIVDLLKSVSIELYPTGRAWYRPAKGVFDNLHGALDLQIARLINESNLFLDSVFPDNENFTAADAKLWEYRLGLVTNENTDLQLRMDAIKRKLGHPNNIKSRQNALFIQSQLQLAGFDVYVHENTIPYKTPGDVAAILAGPTQHGEPTQHGNSTSHGGENYQVIANSIEEFESFGVGAGNLWATFFIGGVSLGDTANVPVSRLREFKELVIKLKPAQTVAFIFINFV